MKKLAAMLLCLSFLGGCNNDDDGNNEPTEPEIPFEEQLAIDEALIDAYLAENGIDAEIDETGLRYVINDPGEGTRPNAASTVIVAYEGRFFDGEVFDSNNSFETSIGGVIAGWQIGLPLIQSGGSITLYIPSGFAYGTVGRGSIEPNTNLIFDISLIGVR